MKIDNVHSVVDNKGQITTLCTVDTTVMYWDYKTGTWRVLSEEGDNE